MFSHLCLAIKSSDTLKVKQQAAKSELHVIESGYLIRNLLLAAKFCFLL